MIYDHNLIPFRTELETSRVQSPGQNSQLILDSPHYRNPRNRLIDRRNPHARNPYAFWSQICKLINPPPQSVNAW